MTTSFNYLPQITPFEELTIQNDFLFQRVMRNKRICKRLIEEILSTKIANISFIHTQKSIKSFYDSKGVFLDVTVEDEQRTRYNLEMQVENRKGKYGNITSNAKSFLHYVKSHKATDEFTQEISSEISKIKRDEKARKEYMQYAIKLYDLQNDAYDKGLERGLQTGLERGAEQEKLNIATTMKLSGKFSDEAIVLATNLTLEQVKAINV